jgi:hypothetical protein
VRSAVVTPEGELGNPQAFARAAAVALTDQGQGQG